MNSTEQTETEVVVKKVFTVIRPPQKPEDVVIPERTLKDKRLMAISNVKHSGEEIEAGSVFKFNEPITDTVTAIYEHLLRYGAIKEVK